MYRRSIQPSSTAFAAPAARVCEPTKLQTFAALSILFLVLTQPLSASAQTEALSRQIDLEADQLDVDLEGGSFRGEGVRLTSCGGCTAPWSVSARRVLLRPGGDIDLTGPILRLGRVPVLTLPWLRIRTGRRWGLLIPRIGTRSGGGFEIGTGVWGPLGARTDLAVRVAYLTKIIGVEIDVELRGPIGELRLTGLAAAEAVDGWDGRIVGHAAWRRRSLTIATDLSWTANAGLARTLAPTPEDEARQQEVSTVALIWANHSVQASIATSLLHDLDAVLAEEAHIPLTAIAADLLPVSVGPLWFGVDAMTSVLWSSGARERHWPGWRAVLEPRVALAGAAGPVAMRWTLASRHALWDGLEHGEATVARHLVVAGADLSLPLIKRSRVSGRMRRHSLEPAIRYRLALVDAFEVPPMLDLPIDPAAWPAAGHLLWVHLRASSRDIATGRGFRIDLAQRVGLPVVTGVSLSQRLQFSFEVAERLASLSFGGAIDEERVNMDEAWTRVRIGRDATHGLRLGWRWLDEDTRDPSEPGPYSVLPTVIPWTALVGGHALDATLWMTLVSGWRFETGLQIDVTRQEMIRLGGALRYAHRCGCLRAGVEAWYRAGRSWPDIVIAVDLAGLGSR